MALLPLHLDDCETFRIPHSMSKRTIRLIDEKTFFLLFLFSSRFYVFNVFFIFQTFFTFKNVGKFRAASRLTRSTFKITATK